MHKRYWILIALWLTLPLVMTSTTAAKIIVSHMHYSSHGIDWYRWLQDRASVFEASNPDIEIDLFVSVDNGVNQLLAMAAGGTLPDVTEFALVHGGSFAGKGFFMDLMTFVERDASVDLNMFAPIAPEALTWTDGKLWGLPADLYTVPTYFNKDLVSEAGLAYPNQLGDDWSWDTLVEYGLRLSRDTNLDGEFDRKAITGLSGMWSHLAIVNQAGGQLFDRYKDPTESRFNSPEVETAIQWIVDLYRLHGVLEDGWYGLSEGTSAIGLTSGPSAINSLNQSGVNFDVALQPKGAASKAAYSVVNSFQISKESVNAEEAWRWIKFLAAEADSMKSFIVYTGRLPAFLPVAQYYGDFIDNPPDNVGLILQNVLDPASYHLPIGPKAQEARGFLNARRTQMLRGEIDVRSALLDAHRQAEAALNAD